LTSRGQLNVFILGFPDDPKLLKESKPLKMKQNDFFFKFLRGRNDKLYHSNSFSRGLWSLIGNNFGISEWRTKKLVFLATAVGLFLRLTGQK